MKVLLLDDETHDRYDGRRGMLDHFRDPCRWRSPRDEARSSDEHRFRRRYENIRNEVTAKDSSAENSFAPKTGGGDEDQAREKRRATGRRGKPRRCRVK